MKKSFNTPPISLHKGQGKYKKIIAQKRRVFSAFHKQPKTMLMVSIETGILRANICRYVAEWIRVSLIKLVETKYCRISNHRAGFYTTNPDLFQAFVEPSNTEKLCK